MTSDHGGDFITRNQYIEGTTRMTVRHPTFCPSSASGTGESSHITLHRYATKSKGSWFVVKTHNLNFAATELLFDGIYAASTVPLSNDAIVDGVDEVDEPNSYEVRFARHIEYCAAERHTCASIIGTASTGTAIYRNVLSIGQIPSETTPLCKADIFVYVPNKFDCSSETAQGFERNGRIEWLHCGGRD